jgi:ATP-dependent DNA ligase
MDFIYPPRPKGRLDPKLLSKYEDGRWVVQRKFNGTRTLIHIVGKTVVFWNRHAEQHKQFDFGPKFVAEILSLNLPENEYWLDGELLATKTKTPEYKGRVVLYDVLQAGKYLFGSPDQMARVAMLRDICRNPQTLEPNHGLALKVTENVWMAQTFEKDFVAEYERFLHCPEIEGVVLRRRDSTLDSFGRKEYEVNWQIRCRKPATNYAF